MPINIPIVIPNVGSTSSLYPPIPFGILNSATPAQQGFGTVTTLISPIFISNSYPITSSAGSYLIYGTAANISVAQEVSDYNNFSLQPDVSGSGTSTFAVSSSIDGFNWAGEFVVSYTSSTTASIYRLTGRRRYLLASHSGSGVATGSLYLVAGQ